MMEKDLNLDYNPQYSIEGVWFRSYTTEEVKALSVKEVTNPEVFDSLRQPTIGGLYDPAFGPSDNFDGCRTCGQGRFHCPGHMGHIELPLPVFNPVFFKTLYRILKSTCFNCHRLIVDPGMAGLFVNQCELLDAGQLAAAGQLEELYGQLTFEKNSEEHASVNQAIAEAAQKFLKESVDNRPIPVKNVEAVRHALVAAFVKGQLRKQVKCLHCHKRVPTLREEHKAKLILLGSAANVADAKRKLNKSINVDDEDDEDSEDDSLMTPGKRKRPGVTDSSLKARRGDVTLLTTLMVREHLYKVWDQDAAVLRRLYPTLASNTCKQPLDIFFLEIIPVPPTKFRPIARIGDKRYENPQTANLAKVLRNNTVIREILWEIEKTSATTQLPADHVKSKVLSVVPGATLVEKLNNAIITLQTSVNCLVDSELDKLSKDVKPGIKQLLEKKEGLLRKNMMGKRVNFAARSVISPDPNINTQDIGIPEVFAMALTYPQPVTPWNVHELRQAVMNGPEKHPGAFQVVNEDGTVVLLNHKNATQREAVAKQLLTPTTVHGRQLIGSKKVLRHLKTGDVLLINRQPTLHRPSIQAHTARVLPGEKTLRLHYANCKAYNADFDGDEMNAHFPQNELGRAEAYNIVSTDYQYLVPKDGTPLAGLIQDHMVSGVSLTIRGRMFSKSDYCRLVYTALVDKGGPIRLLPPCIIKPYRLWSGKQVLSTVVLNVLPHGKPALCLTGRSKVPEKSWIKEEKRNFSVETVSHMGESDVIIRHGELLCGVLDKGHYGPTPYGLIHSCYELYGGQVAGKLLTCFGRLFLNFLQWKGFTLGVEDILVRPKAEKKRHKIIKASMLAGDRASRKALGLDNHCDEATLHRALRGAQFNSDDSRLRELDMAMRNETNTIQNDIVNACMPKGLEKLFPDNNLQLMVVSGAKGSSVNCMQISCLLGQIELEGKRPPLMMSGRTLPSFLEYDVTPRAGGFVTGRFLTGIRQQEYFFHCMAGREGLVDTAVKTSRSGYLQRCLIKHLEGVKVNYDLTVRDGDSSIIQFYYGEDSFDICKTSYINPQQFPFLAENHQILSQGQQPKLSSTKAVGKLEKKIRDWQRKHRGQFETKKIRRSGFLHFCQEVGPGVAAPTDAFAGEGDRASMVPGRGSKDRLLCDMWVGLDAKQKHRYMKAGRQCPDPVISHYSLYTSGALPEKASEQIRQYAKSNLRTSSLSLSDSQFVELMDGKLKRSIVEPGEAVGLLCAQSIGEPSTQMTLNTFHFAGRGEMNVTLGIPRLREILMVGSRNIKTPAMDVPVVPTNVAKDKAKQLQKKFTKVYLNEVLKDLQVQEWLAIKERSKMLRRRMFAVRFNFLPKACYQERFIVTPNQILQFVEKVYVKKMVQVIRQKIKTMTRTRLLNHGTHRVTTSSAGRKSRDDEDDAEGYKDLTRTTEDLNSNQKDEDEESDDEDEANDGDNVADKQKKRHQDEHDYDDEIDEEDDDDDEKKQKQRRSSLDDDVELDDELVEPEDLEEMIIEEYEAKERKDDSRKARVRAVLDAAPEVFSYTFDTKKQLWCEVTLGFALQDSKLDLLSLLEDHVRKVVVHEVENISRCFLNEEKGPQGTELHLKTEGINMQELYKYSEMLQLNRLYSNNIHSMADTYGIEAASKAIIKEIQAVFAAYGIVVDYRHLSLLADYMTFEGTYKPFNRISMETNPSPLQKMSFETTMHFLVDASISHKMDNLTSPSAQIVVGKNVSCGTGCLDLFTPLTVS